MTIELRPFEEFDYPVAWLWMRDAWAMIADDFSPTDLEIFLQMKRTNADLDFGVYRDGQLGGILTCVPVTPAVCIGHCVFSRSFWGRQTTEAALREGMRVAWKMGYAKIWCHVFEENRPMIGLLARVGAVFEGRLVNQARRNGRPVDCLSYAILRDDSPHT